MSFLINTIAKIVQNLEFPVSNQMPPEKMTRKKERLN